MTSSVVIKGLLPGMIAPMELTALSKANPAGSTFEGH
jgi:hypothetical protein